MTGPVTALKKIRARERVLVSVHHRNDRGTAVGIRKLDNEVPFLAGDDGPVPLRELEGRMDEAREAITRSLDLDPDLTLTRLQEIWQPLNATSILCWMSPFPLMAL